MLANCVIELLVKTSSDISLVEYVLVWAQMPFFALLGTVGWNRHCKCNVATTNWDSRMVSPLSIYSKMLSALSGGRQLVSTVAEGCDMILRQSIKCISDTSIALLHALPKPLRVIVLVECLNVH